MIIDFTFENFTSFRDEASFSMMKTLERQHAHHIAVVQEYGLKLLPIAAIFGGNASGKSNFIAALSTMESIVLTKVIGSNYFLLDKKFKDKETVFCIRILVKKIIYEFSFSVLSSIIIQESLKKITPVREILLYERFKKEKINIPDEIFNKNDINIRLKVNFEGTDDNQLFLNNVISQNKTNAIEELQDFKNVYEWFASKLCIINADSKPGRSPFSSGLIEEVNQLIPQFDLGFNQGKMQETEIIHPEKLEVVKEFFSRNLNGDGEIQRLGFSEDGPFIVCKGDKYYEEEIILSHTVQNGIDVTFPLKLESDGSKRILNLLPALLMLLKKDVVCVIDELDRSLHTLLSRKFIQCFLEKCSSEKRSQLIFTTHDVTLLNQDIFRRDELWVVDRDPEAVSKMFALSEYKDIRSDKDVQKSYLNGRFGGIPNVLL